MKNFQCTTGAVALLLVLLSSLICNAGNPKKLIPESWERGGILPVPPLLKSPLIDGKVESREWEGATKTCCFYRTLTGLLYEPGMELYLGYKNKKLYLAWKIKRPAGNKKPKITFKPGHHKFIWTRTIMSKSCSNPD